SMSTARGGVAVAALKVRN
ncbi:unnamed protein product, partial [Rotaria sordida]